MLIVIENKDYMPPTLALGFKSKRTMESIGMYGY